MNYFLIRTPNGALVPLPDWFYDAPAKNTKNPRRIYQTSYYHEWIYEDRDGREVTVGKFDVSEVRPVRRSIDKDICAVCFKFHYKDRVHEVELSINEYQHRNFLHKFSFVERNPDCSDKILTDTIAYALQQKEFSEMYIIPSQPGWCRLDDGTKMFASSQSVYPLLESYYPREVKECIMVDTSCNVRDIARDLRNALSCEGGWNLAMAIGTASLVLDRA